MLIIFDLDDTLVDTSACITPLKLEEALYAMLERGLEVKDFPSALHCLLSLNDSAESSPAALEAFITRNGYDEKFYPIAMAKMREPLSSDSRSNLMVPYALAMLETLKGRHQMAIVTIGAPELQLSKLKKAGIDPTLFCKIAVIEVKNKKPVYQSLLDETRLSPREVVVCGDRPALDLVPAKELLCHTVHLKRGRGKKCMSPDADSGVIDFTIEDWRGFPAHIDHLETLV